jgi:peptidoglycan/xylan/chitin deacetylase (PgdA/CDA1 family)
MSRRTTQLLRTALSTLHYTGVAQLLKPVTAGLGVVFMLHSVSPALRQAFEPNRILRVNPRFLETVMVQTRKAGFDIVSLDEVPQRLQDGGERPFAVFTLDDGYRDNRDYAYPIFKRHDVPFTIYVPSDYGDGRGDLWWLNLENAVRSLDRIELEMDGVTRAFAAATVAEKDAAHHAIYWWLRRQPEHRARALVSALSRQAGHDPGALGRDLLMTWSELRELAKDPLVTIGGHTKGHYAIGRLAEAEAREEMVGGARRIEQEIGQPCRHFSFPYGDELAAGPRDFEMAREAGFLTAVTTRKGLLYAQHGGQLTALPRLSLNGDFQDERYVKTLLSGAPFAIRDALLRLRPA